MSTPDEKDQQNFFKVDKVDVDVKQSADQARQVEPQAPLQFLQAASASRSLTSGAAEGSWRRRSSDKFTEFDRLLVAQIKLGGATAPSRQRARIPTNAPNIYSRYVSAAAEAAMLQGKQKARGLGRADKKVNYAVTGRTASSHHIHLPGVHQLHELQQCQENSFIKKTNFLRKAPPGILVVTAFEAF